MVIINVTYDQGFQNNPQARNAFQAAVDVWANTLISPQPIRINAFYDGVPAALGLIGICIPNGVRGFQGAPNPHWWYVSALGKRLANADLNPNVADMDVHISNTLPNWCFTTGNQPCPPNQLDFMTNALHEICHGLGFISLFTVGGPPLTGEYGRITANMLPPTSFPFPNLDGWASVLGATAQNALAQTVIGNPNVQSTPSAQLANRITRQDAAFGPPLLRGQNATYEAYAPAPFELFSSMDHLEQGTFPHSLMRPALAPGEVIRAPDAPVMDILRGMGW
jgi:hypothetical protein